MNEEPEGNAGSSLQDLTGIPLNFTTEAFDVSIRLSLKRLFSLHLSVLCMWAPGFGRGHGKSLGTCRCAGLQRRQLRLSGTWKAFGSHRMRYRGPGAPVPIKERAVIKLAM